MKKLSFILLLAAAMLLSATNSFASPPLKKYAKPPERVKLLSNEEFFSQSDYIIETKSAGICPTYYDAGGNRNPDDFYISAFMIVTHVYKNDETMPVSPGDTLNYILKGGMITIPSEKHPLEGDVIESPRPVDYDTGERGYVSMMDDEYQSILLLKKSDFPENPDVSRRNKYPKVSMVQDIKRASIKIGGRGFFTGPIWGLNGLQFENRYELYKYMEQFEGVTVPLSDPAKMWSYLHHYDGLFDQYRKERNIDWKLPSERTQEDIDAFNRLMEMKVRIAQENSKIVKQ